MTVARKVKIARRRAIEAPGLIDRPWIVDTLVPTIVLGLIFWAAGIAGVLAFAGPR